METGADSYTVYMFKLVTTCPTLDGIYSLYCDYMYLHRESHCVRNYGEVHIKFARQD
jgi:hypothetical protein